MSGRTCSNHTAEGTSRSGCESQVSSAFSEPTQLLFLCARRRTDGQCHLGLLSATGDHAQAWTRLRMYVHRPQPFGPSPRGRFPYLPVGVLPVLYVGSGDPDGDLTLTETPGWGAGDGNRVQKTWSGQIPTPPGASLPGTQATFRLLPSLWI